MRRRTVFAMGAAAAIGYGLERALFRRSRHGIEQASPAHLAPVDGAVERTVVAADGGEVHVVDVGSGTPIVLLHGVTLSVATWHHQLRSLSAAHRVVALDHRGHGGSRAGSAGHRLDALVDEVVDVLEALDLRGAVLVGHSMGGMVVQRLLARRPAVRDARLCGAVLLATTGQPGVSVPGWRAVTRGLTPLAARAIRRAGRLPGGLLPPRDLSYALTRVAFGRAPSAAHVELTRAMAGAMSGDVLAELWPDLLGVALLTPLCDVHLPVLVLAGDRDAITPVGQARRLAAALPDSVLVVVPGAGHMLMLEQADTVNDEIVRFVERVAA